MVLPGPDLKKKLLYFELVICDKYRGKNTGPQCVVLFAPILRSTTAAYSHRCVYEFGMLVHWYRYWLGHHHTFIRLKLTVLKV
jgi:hypothetical protein